MKHSSVFLLTLAGLAMIAAITAAAAEVPVNEPGSEPTAAVPSTQPDVDPPGQPPVVSDTTESWCERAANEDGLEGLSRVLALELCRLSQESDVFPKECFRRVTVNHRYDEDVLWQDVVSFTGLGSMKSDPLVDFGGSPDDAEGREDRWMTSRIVVIDYEHVLLVQFQGWQSSQGRVADELVLGCLGTESPVEKICQDIAAAVEATGVGCDRLDQRVSLGLTRVVFAKRDGRYLVVRFVRNDDDEMKVWMLTRSGPKSYKIAVERTVKFPPRNPRHGPEYPWSELRIPLDPAEPKPGDEGGTEEFTLVYKRGILCMESWPQWTFVSAEDVDQYGIPLIANLLDEMPQWMSQEAD